MWASGIADLRLEEGKRALWRSDWDGARAAFEAAVREQPTPEAVEALSWAAWWQNDTDALFEARERAFRLYRDAGDDRGAARMAMWIASDHFDFRGELAVGNGWRQRARRLLANLPTGHEHAWMAILDSDLASHVEDDTDVALRAAQEAIAIGRRLGYQDAEIIGLALEGHALVHRGDVPDGLSRLDEAGAAALGGELQEIFPRCMVLCYLICACETARDYERAEEWCQKGREYADRLGFVIVQGVCRANYGSVLIWRGKWAEAEKELSEAARDFQASRPPSVPEAIARLGELRRRQGRSQEAESLFREIEWHGLAALGLANLALDAGRPRDSEEYVQRVLRNTSEKTLSSRLAAFELLVKIHAATGDHASARDSYREFTAIAYKMGTPPVTATGSYLAGIVESAAGGHETARRHFEDAALLFARNRAPYEAAHARVQLARAFKAVGRPDRAREEARNALDALSSLGAIADAERVASLLNELQGAAPAHGLLTERQVEVLRLVARGLGDREIAAALVMSEHTVHRHVANILQRLDQPSRAAAVAHASRLGLI
jgi:LuxR family transcriptional regulator, maltose regulon positive regulatory protein